MSRTRLAGWHKRVRAELIDALELVLLPGLAIFLPWALCFKLFKRMARWRWLYREQCEAALAGASTRGWVKGDEAQWIWERRLVTLVDHADHYIGLWRSDRWLGKHLQIEGQWPDPAKTALLTTFHWGAGYWGLRHAAAHGLRPHALVASLGAQVFQGRAVMSWYYSARNANVAATLRASTIDIASHLKQVIRAVQDKRPLLGLMDVPADSAKTCVPITLLGMQASVPRGLMRLAVDHQVPVVLYITGLNTQTGQRFLRIKPMGVQASVETMATQVFAELELLIVQDAPAWHFWSLAERFFRARL